MPVRAAPHTHRARLLPPSLSLILHRLLLLHHHLFALLVTLRRLHRRYYTYTHIERASDISRPSAGKAIRSGSASWRRVRRPPSSRPFLSLQTCSSVGFPAWIRLRDVPTLARAYRKCKLRQSWEHDFFPPIRLATAGWRLIGRADYGMRVN